MQQCRARRQSAAILLSHAPHDSKARLIPLTTRRDSWRSHVHRTHTAQRVQSFKLQSANVGGRGALPSRSLGGPRGPFSHVREWPPYLRTLRHAGNKVQSTALPKIPPFSKEKRTPLPRRSSYFCESKIYRYFCMPSVARAGSPETEMVNLTPVALLKRSSSFRKSSAAWLHSPPVILNRLSMKMWEIS